MADILLSVGMQTGSAVTSEFMSQLNGMVNALNKGDNTVIKLRPVIDSAGLNDLRSQLSSISNMVEQISQKNFNLNLNIDDSQNMREKLGVYKEQIRDYVRHVKLAYDNITTISQQAEIKALGTAATPQLEQAREAYEAFYKDLEGLEKRLNQTSTTAGASRVATDAQKMLSAIQPLIDLAKDSGALTFGESFFKFPEMISEANGGATTLKANIESIATSLQTISGHIDAAAKGFTNLGNAAQSTSNAVQDTSRAEQSVNRLTALYKELSSLQKQMGETKIQLATETDSEKVSQLLAKLRELSEAYNKIFYSGAADNLSSEQLAKLAKQYEDYAAKAQAASDKRIAAEIAAEEKAAAAREKAAEKAAAAAEKAAQKAAAAAEKKAAAEQAAAEKAAAAEEKAAQKAAATQEREYQRAANAALTNLKKLQSQINSTEIKLVKLDPERDATRINELTQQLRTLKAEYQSLLDATQGKLSEDQMQQLTRHAEALDRKLRDTKAAWADKQNSLQSGLNTLESRFVYMFSMANVVLAGVRQLKNMVKTVVELDSAMTQLRVVTNASEADYSNYSTAVAKTAQEIGSSIKDLVDSTTVFARLGYTLDESSNLAKYTQLLSNVGNIDVSSAQNALTAITKAYDISASEIESVMDKMVQVGKRNCPRLW